MCAAYNASSVANLAATGQPRVATTQRLRGGVVSPVESSRNAAAGRRAALGRVVDAVDGARDRCRSHRFERCDAPRQARRRAAEGRACCEQEQHLGATHFCHHIGLLLQRFNENFLAVFESEPPSRLTLVESFEFVIEEDREDYSAALMGAIERREEREALRRRRALTRRGAGRGEEAMEEAREVADWAAVT